MLKIPRSKSFGKFLILILVFTVGLGIGARFLNEQVLPFGNKQSLVAEKNTPKSFVSEIYDKIKENYWNNISDAELLDLFKLSMDRNGAGLTVVKFEDKNKLLDAVSKSVAGMNDEQKNQFLATVVSQVLSSLAPAGRSGLYTQKQEEQLKNTVSNINPEKDLYKDLGLKKGASESAVLDSFKKLSASASGEQLKTLTYAKDTLTQKDQKERYDKAGIEPTIFTKILSPGILYVQFKKFSPTSLEEFQKAFENYEQVPSSGSKSDTSLNALIFDLRGNVGGAIDATAYFLGFFLGKGQYAFDFYHKGEYLPFKTQTDKMQSITRFKQVVVLIDQNSQSSAEMMAASLKKYHTGVLVGVPTKGWGTVERVFPLDNQISSKEKYSIFLVHSLTLRDDNQPIEGRGVEPDISIKDAAWPQKLLQYFNNQPLVDSVKSIL
ncbi:hypothetical protein HYS95_01765 [Candidatus Daviesbacteria bacterium]|nr:hypothetical protein [Candidatus Daviesbacteria bacterium]